MVIFSKSITTCIVLGLTCSTLLIEISQVQSLSLSLSLSRDAGVVSNGNGLVSRRDVLIGTTTAAGIGVFWSPQVASAASDGDSDSGGAVVAPIAVVGASGRTGALCVASCLRRGIPVKALTRTGTWPPTGGKIDLKAVNFNQDDVDATIDIANNPLLTIATCDVKDPKSLATNLAGCRGVIYAASASKKGGNSKEIDLDGVLDAGTACLQANVPRYVVLSSGSTTRPNSLGFKFTEMAVKGIMTNKRLGELGVREAFSNNNSKALVSSSSSYTIVRPGGLDEPKQNIIQGPSALEITQGDVLAGFVSRADVAEVAVELALSKASNVKNTAFELYYQNKVVTVDGKYKKYLDPTNGVVDRLHGSTYEELFKGIQPNFDYLVDV